MAKKKGMGKGLGVGLGIAAAGAAALYFVSRAKAVPPLEPGKAGLYGKVTDADTGSALDGIMVSVDSVATYTGIDGKYQMTDIEPGSYAVIFSDPQGEYETATY